MDIIKKEMSGLNTPMRMIILSSFLLTVLVIIALFFLAAHMREDEIITVSGSAGVDFRVFYMDNEFFAENPVPHTHDMGFLMSFTDFIEVDSTFNVRFHDATEILYRYNAEYHLIIRYMGSMNGVTHPIVFRQIMPLSSARGSVFADRLDGPSGTYIIFPKNYTDIYLEFIAVQTQLMYDENVIAQGLRGFSAELLIDFSLTIIAPELGITETASTGYRMSLSTEIFTLLQTGNAASSFINNINLSQPPPRVTMLMAILFVAAAALSVYGLVTGIQNHLADANPIRREALHILKKYSNEIVVSDMPLPLTYYRTMKVGAFDDLLRLAINLNKHIMCHHNSEMAEFAVVVEGNVYYFKITYGTNGGTTPALPEEHEEEPVPSIDSEE
ncbi:MAG: DUF5305 domain-containing protein [Defluviitaleaceae bacterium]|nr:DUF5305 domain-containing protein [Defluviitaleaceae bacterium]